MDSTAGDLDHAVKEVDAATDEKLIRESSASSEEVQSEQTVVQDKKEQEGARHSSGSSSDDEARLDKLDSHIIKILDAKEGEEAYAHLPDHEKEIVKRQLDIPVVKVGYTTLFRYATKNDLIIIGVSFICAIAGGAVMPLLTVSF